jgi:glycosyltransferase involved in cell wall biosynthesis
MPVRRIFLYEEKKYEQLPMDENDLVLPFRDNHFFEKIPTVQPQLVKALAREIRIFEPDVILCNGSRTLKYAAVVKKCYPSINSKWVYRVIDSAKYWNNRSLTQVYYKYFIIPAMDGAIGVSQKSLNEMIQHYGFLKPSVCIPRAIDVDYFAKYQLGVGARQKIGIPSDAFVLLFLGNFTRQKRPDRFIEIIYGLQRELPQFHGLMVGDGPLKKESEEKVEKLGLIGKITFAGYQQDVRPWISMSDILLLTSDTEGMPGVVLEAGAMKKSTISNDIGGIKEIISDQTNGFVVLNGEVNKFISYIKILTRNNELKTNFENGIFNSVRERNNMETIFVTYKKFLNQIRFGI